MPITAALEMSHGQRAAAIDAVGLFLLCADNSETIQTLRDNTDWDIGETSGHLKEALDGQSFKRKIESIDWRAFQ